LVATQIRATRVGGGGHRHKLSRYLAAADTVGDARLRLFPEGRCQWCGKELLPPNRSYCPAEDCYGYKRQKCTESLYYFWYTRPRYQRLVLLRDKFTCQNCGLRPTVTDVQTGIVRPDLSRLHVDHIVPFCKVLATTFDNLQVLCRSCNLTKGNRPERLTRVRLLW